MVKSHEKKCQNYFRVTANDTVKCHTSQQEKMMNFYYGQEYLKGEIKSIMKKNIQGEKQI